MKTFPSCWNRALAVWTIALALSASAAHGATIASFQPASGPEGTQITVVGSGFLGTTNVMVGDVLADHSVLAHDRLLVIVPPLPITGPLRVGAPGGGAVSAASFVASPRITGFSPERSGTNMIVYLEGANFTGASQVQFAGSNALFTVTAATQIRATVPYGATSGPARVVAPGGVAVSSTPFTVISPAPVVDLLVPAVGAPGSAVRIEGVNFKDASRVTFNGAAASFSVTADTQIFATVPATVSTGPVAVTTPKGTGTSSAPFTVTRAPVITNFHPIIGIAGTPVTIEGINFTNITGVSFNGKSVTGFGTPAPGQLQVTVPNGATTGFIRVTNAFGIGASTLAFTVTSAPIIDTFEPELAAPGAIVVLNGANFSGATAVKYSGQAAAFAVTAPTQIRSTVPAGATSGFISVHNVSGSATSAVPFTVIGSAPFVRAFVPSSGPRGTPVILEGLNFINVTAVTFNGTNAQSFAATAPSQIHAVVPAGVTTGPIKVTTTAGSFTTTNWYHGPPRVTQISPLWAWEGDAVTVTGTNLISATGLQVGGKEWPFVVVDGNTLRATVPPLAVDGTLRVATPGGVFLSTSPFTVLPRIDQIAPLLGPPGTTVTISGSGLGFANAVRFGGGVGATFQVVSSQELRAVVPALAQSGAIEVDTPAGTAMSPQTFTVTGSSDLSLAMSVSRSSIKPGESVTFRVELRNRGPALVSDVRFTNSLPLGLVLFSASSSLGPLVTQGRIAVLTLDTFEAGGFVTMDIVASAPGEGVFTNFATVIARETDLNAANNAAIASVVVAGDAGRMLRIQPVGPGTHVVLSWPTSAIPYAVEMSTNLANPFGWISVSGQPVIKGGVWTWTNAVSGTKRFFRLTLTP